MEFIRGIHNLQRHHYGCVLTIGNFDGFHLGHQSIIAELQKQGKIFNLPVMVMMFEPQPQEYFFGDTAPTRLTLLRDKVKYIANAGVDIILCINFNNKFATLTARSFVIDLLVQKLGVCCLGLGKDFRFGIQRQGDYSLLVKMGKEFGFKVIKVITYTKNEQRISSTSVRKALSQDRLEEAKMLLGHSYCISGNVIHGDKLGRTIGFPTANLSLKGRKISLKGVYVVEVHGITNSPFFGVANIGTRPTISGFKQQLEVHLLDININLYGITIEVVIHKKLRNEQKFSSLSDLKKQIIHDITSARDHLKQKILL